MKNKSMEKSLISSVEKLPSSRTFESRKTSNHPIKKWLKNKSAQKKGFLVHEILKKKPDLF